jgi:NAD-dependent deacetylase
MFYIDPKPVKIPYLRNLIEIIPMNAAEGVLVLKQMLSDLI